jgi:hypothetical protein
VLLKTSALFCGFFACLTGGVAHAQAAPHWNVPFKIQGAVGFDAWDIQNNAENAAHERVLFLANSTPQWTERNPSPWVRLDTELALSEDWTGRVKFRGAQNTDWRVDELNLNWDVSPKLGLSAGVVDYKTSWCRPYDVDSPWVRENDPFCTVRTTDQATGAAPGIQAYTQWGGNAWTLQTHLGVFDPLVMGYDKTDFGNTTLKDRSEVLKNRKVGGGFSWLHHYTATEARLGLLYTQQSADWDAYADDAPLIRLNQEARLVFAGLNFHPMPSWSMRLTHIYEQLDGHWLNESENRRDRQRKSVSVENIFRINSSNSLALAWAQYQIRVNDEWRFGSDGPWSALPLDVFDNTIVSISWRKDWSPWLFSSVQASHAKTKFDFFGLGTAQPSGNGLGLRVGLRF